MLDGTFADSMLKSSGRLRRRYLPAVYVDPGFLARYWAASREHDPTAGDPQGVAADPPLPAHHPLGAAETAAFAALRSRVAAGALPVNVVVSSLALFAWLEQLIEAYRERLPGSTGGATAEEADFQGMRFQSWCNRLVDERLAGMLRVDLREFSLSGEEVWEQLPAALLLQGVRGSVLHVLAARHLGCTHLATLDAGSARACALLEGRDELTPVTSPEALLQLLTS